MWMFLKVVLSSTFLLILLGEAVSGARLSDYSRHNNKRPSMTPRRRVNKIPSVEACAVLCESLSSIRCTMFTVRERGMRCMMYSNDQATNPINVVEELINAVGFTTFHLELDGECIKDTDPAGIRYRGTQSTTKGGRTCQQWNKDTPHRTIYRPINAGKHKNYCRNPDKDSTGPWCYTTSKHKRWEYCSIPECTGLTRGTSATATATETSRHTSLTTRTVSSASPTLPASTSVTSTPEPEPEPCFVCNGNAYIGTLDHTASGWTCQRWSSSVPHEHTNHPYQKPERNLEGNYCRNPDGDVKPWCYTTDPGTRWEYCGARRCTNPDGSVFIPRAEYSTDCSTGAGENYRGNVNVTQSGKTCGPWTSQAPHKHSRTPENYPCSGLERNFCRNPSSNFEGGPWCYTTESSTRWEMCDVPKCGPDGRPITTTTTTTRSTTASSTPATRATTTASPTPATTNKRLISAFSALATSATTKPAGTCGIQAIEPSFSTQSFNIVDDRVVPSRRRKRSNQQTNRILGGDIAIHGSWPWSVSIRYHDVHFCGGTLVRPKWVLTASHCLDDNAAASYMSVKAGHFTGREPQMQMRKVKRYILHESYSKKNVKNDIALILMKTPFTLNDYVNTACLPNPEYIVPGETYCVATGWGNTYDPKYENQLKQAVLPVHSYANCVRYMGSHMVDKTQMCAGFRAQGTDTCRGDSGGPLVCLNNNHWTLQGVTSWGSGCEDKKGSYGSYTRVSKYIGWVNGQIARHS